MAKPVSGFSKCSKDQKIEWLASHYFSDARQGAAILKQYWNDNQKLQKLHDEFIENAITNYYLPLGIAPNFLINDSLYALPMAIEESSVVAAASNAAKFWLDKGGFEATVINTVKNGQVHFNFDGPSELLQTFFNSIHNVLLEDTKALTASMKRRGGGILSLELIDQTQKLDNYYQLSARFETKDAMGANFINSCLEQIAQSLQREAGNYEPFTTSNYSLSVVMSILSNYVPECVATARVSCAVEQLATPSITGQEFAAKFVRAINIANASIQRAVTHNKGIMNGIDAVVLATGNDFRAVEAGVHAYAAKSGNYQSLTQAKVEDGIFSFYIEVPLALGTVGGLTKLHPLVKLNLEILKNPTATQLMEIIATAGLAQNFAAIRSLITTGIQQGHMKMHLKNILNQLEATDQEKQAAIAHFSTVAVSHAAAKEFILSYRNR